MDIQTQNALWLEALLDGWHELEAILGDDWPPFRDRLSVLIESLLYADPADVEGITRTIDEIRDLGLDSAAARWFRQVDVQIQIQVGAREARPPSAAPAEPKSALPSMESMARALYNSLLSLLPRGTPRSDESYSMGPPPEPAATPEARHLNAGFFGGGGDEPLPTGEPLSLAGGPYRLGVNVGPFWGPGSAGETTIDDVVDLSAARDPLAMDVVVDSRTVGVQPPRQTLLVPREGSSDLIFFDLVFGQALRHAINVDLFHHGHLLLSRRIEVEVVRQVGDTIPAGRPPQDGCLIFSRAGRLDPEQLKALGDRPRRLTITAHREGDSLSLLFYDRERGPLGEERTTLNDTSLVPLLRTLRDTLLDVTKGYRRVGGDLEQLRLSLWKLAAAGNRLYSALLPTVFDPYLALPGSRTVDLDLEPRQVIQVAPLSAQAGIPWELMYERAVEPFQATTPDRVRLCPDWQAHRLDPCPHAGDERVVCPYGFWGLSYIIEQLPNRRERGETPPARDLPLQIRNGLPMRLAAMIYEFPDLADHLEKLAGLAPGIVVERIDTFEGVERTLKDAAHPADVLYFYTHAGFQSNEPVLRMGLRSSEFQFTHSHLSNWRTVDLSSRQPLVVINACESAGYRPDHFESFVQRFVARGASGLVGTQCEVPTNLADVFIRAFFRALVQKGTTAGEALFRARHELLFHREPGGELCPDPRGLVYSLFAAADIQLAQYLPEWGASTEQGGNA